MLSFKNYFAEKFSNRTLSLNGNAFAAMPPRLEKPRLIGLPLRTLQSSYNARLVCPNERANVALAPTLSAFLGCDFASNLPANTRSHDRVMTRFRTITSLTTQTTLAFRNCVGPRQNIAGYLRIPRGEALLRTQENGGLLQDISPGTYHEFALDISTLVVPLVPVLPIAQISVSQLWSGPAIPLQPIARSIQSDTKSAYNADRAYAGNIRAEPRNAWRSIALEYACPEAWYHGEGGFADLEAAGLGTEIVAMLTTMPLTTEFRVDFRTNLITYTLDVPDTCIHGVLTSITSSVLRRSTSLGAYYTVRLAIELCL